MGLTALMVIVFCVENSVDRCLFELVQKIQNERLGKDVPRLVSAAHRTPNPIT